MCPLLNAAGPREGVLSRLVPDHPHHGRQAQPRDVAGHLALRAPRPRGLTEGCDHVQRLPQRLESEPPQSCVSNGIDE